jgi:hypothetical protein
MYEAAISQSAEAAYEEEQVWKKEEEDVAKAH